MEAVELTRREFLAAALGAPAAALACSRRPEPRPNLQGTLLQPSARLAHELLTFHPRAAPEPSKVGVVIVGGGIAGLTAAWRLARAGFSDFVLLELEPALGGTSGSGPDYPWAAHYVPAPAPSNRLLVAILREMGCIDEERPNGEISWKEEWLCHAPQERLFYKGLWYEGLYLAAGATSEDLRQLGAFHRAMEGWGARRDRQGRRAFALPSAHGSDDPELTALDRLSMAEYMDQCGWTSPRLRWLAEYGARDDYGLRLDQVSAWAGIFYFASRLNKAGEGPSEYLTWPEGNGRVARHLAAAAAGKLRTGVMVYDIAPQGRGVRVSAVDAASREPLAFMAEHVICATPTFVARRLVAPYRERAPAHLNRFRYTPWVVANVFLRERPASRGFPMAWDNVLYESQSLGYVVNTHQRDADRGPTVWTWYDPLCGEEPGADRFRLLDAGWERWADAVLADLSRAHQGLPELVERIDVFRWGHAMIRPEKGFVWSEARRRAAEPLGRVHFAHTDLSGMALVEEATWHGARAAEAVLREEQQGIESLL
jgi:protoporphyrinogen oxidase